MRKFMNLIIKYPYRWQRSKEDITRDKIKELNKTLVGLKKREKQESEKYGVETELYDLVGGIRDLMNPKGQKDWRGNRGLRELQNEIAKETR
jgi:hypothetical protein